MTAGSGSQEVKEEAQEPLSRKREKDAEGKSKRSLRVFRTIEPEGVCAVSQDSEWEVIEMAVDSAATETVVGEEMLKSIEMKEGTASKRGVEYEVANGIRIPNLRERDS